MKAGLLRWLKRAGILAVVVVVTLFEARIVETQRGPPLRVWHTYVPEELTVDEMERTDWAGYVKAEAALFDRLGLGGPTGPGTSRPRRRSSIGWAPS